jgi:peptide-methionine (S)-S-oxide reductase
MTEKATFAAGCFWGVEEAFRKTSGVVSTAVGYTGGRTDNPSYQLVCAGNTGHAEAVLVEFDPERVSYPDLLAVFWAIHDPTTQNRQGPDVGTQYRSAVYFHDAGQEAAVRASIEEQGGRRSGRPIVTEVAPAPAFHMAEDYHQQYVEKQTTRRFR